MNFPRKSWFRRRRERKEDSAQNGVEHLRAGQVLQAEGDHPSPASLVLHGRCESPVSLSAGDAISEPPAGPPQTTIRAIADSAILRLSRDALRRLAQRWPVMGGTRAARPASLEIVRPEREDGGRVVCLMPLSEGIPCAEFAAGIAETISKETAGSVLRVMAGGMDASRSRNGSPAPVPGHDGIFLQRVHCGKDGKDLRALVELLGRAREQFPHVLVEVAEDVPVEAFLEILRRSWAVYPILRQSGEGLFALNLLAREVRAQGLEAVPIKPLVYLEAAEDAHGLSCYIEETIKRPVHLYLREAAGDDLRLRENLRRLGREMCGRQVGLALSSGAARGLSHIGVIQVLEENGIEVDVVSGSSMGAYIAAVWGVGYGGREMERFAREVKGYRGLWGLADMAIYPRRGFLLPNRVRRRLEQTIGPAHFSDMVRPVRVVATRLDTLERVVFSGGNVVDAVLASVAIPGICVPVTFDGVPYIDGGICDPLPVDVLTGMGIRKIIAVNTIATPETIRACQSEADEPAGFWTGKLNSWFNPFARGNAFDTMMRSIHAAQTRLAEASCREASIVLRPYWCHGRWHDFGNPSRYIPLGREAAEAQLPAIRALVDSPNHENEKTDHVMAPAA